MEESELNYIKVRLSLYNANSKLCTLRLTTSTDDQRWAKTDYQQLLFRLFVPQNCLLPPELAHQDEAYILRSGMLSRVGD